MHPILARTQDAGMSFASTSIISPPPSPLVWDMCKSGLLDMVVEVSGW